MLNKGVTDNVVVNTKQEAWDYPSVARATISDMFGMPPDMMHKLGSVMGNIGGGIPLNMTPGAFNPFAGMMGQESIPGQNSDCQEERMENDVSHTDLNRWREKQLQVMSKYMHSNKESENGAGNHEMMEVRSDEVNSKSSSPLTSSRNSSLSSPLSDGSGADCHQHIHEMSHAHQDKAKRFLEYGTLQVDDKTQELIDGVQAAIIGSHHEHCYHQRPIINAAIAELDAREMVS